MGQFLHSLLFFLLHFQLFTFSSSSATLCPNNQRNALLQFKNSLSIYTNASFDCDNERFTSYPKINFWKKEKDCCKWDGVTCESVTGNVIGLDLSCSQLQGSIQPNSSLFFLSHLQNLNLAFNDFGQSQILPEFSFLVRLTHLNLSYSNFSGEVPPEISRLSQLLSLDLSNNAPLLRLENPTWNKLIQNLTNLSELLLDFVYMSSNISPTSLMNLSSLTSISLSHCSSLRGEFPGSIFSLPNLQKVRLLGNLKLKSYFPKSKWSSSISYLDVSGTNFSGELPDTIGNLKSLQYLNLQSCDFTGLIPTSLGNLKELRYLDLSFNSFSGQFPSFLSKLYKLTHLILQGNQISGQVPDVFGNLSTLTVLSLGLNDFIGRLPQSIFGLTQLNLLHFSNNQLVGDISSQVVALPNLMELDLSSNSLNGTIPCFANMSSLRILSLQNNKLHGQIPNSIFEVLTRLTKLDLSSNNLSGIVDLNMFSKHKNLTLLDLSFNSLTLRSNIKDSNYSLPLLTTLYLSSNNLTEFPHFFRALGNLQHLEISNCQIQGNVPKWLSNMGNLLYLDLSHNKLTFLEQIPWNNLFYLDLQSNLLQGPIVLPPPFSSIAFLIISNNKLTGEIPFSVCNLSYLQVLDMSNNSMEGKIPQCLGNLTNKVLSVLNLNMNRFHGTIPSTFAKGSKLRNLNLGGNQLEGPIPHQLINCRKLEILDLKRNKISGSFPYWLESLPNLQVLILRTNKFHGQVGDPKINFPFPMLRIMDLSNNDFEGPLPQKYIKNLKAMMTVDNGMFQYLGENYYQDSVTLIMKGSEFELERILSIFTVFDFSYNNFGGEVPSFIGELKSLHGLNLSHNRLAGSLPSTLGNLINLEWLDLSSNKMVGEIPWQMTELTSLAVLNLSYNHLEGPIPTGRQFNTFQSDSYEGNLGLCGFPLSKICGSDEERPSSPGNFYQEESDGLHGIIDWKSILVGCGCGMVFGISLGCIVLSERKIQRLIKVFEGKYGRKHLGRGSKQRGRIKGGRRSYS